MAKSRNAADDDRSNIHTPVKRNFSPDRVKGRVVEKLDGGFGSIYTGNFTVEMVTGPDDTLGICLSHYQIGYSVSSP
jgi:hypothetical protein